MRFVEDLLASVKARINRVRTLSSTDVDIVPLVSSTPAKKRVKGLSVSIEADTK